MKKFSKVLLLAVLALALTAVFAISALAADGEGSPATASDSAIQYTAADGVTVTYHPATDFPTLVAQGGEVKLLSDIEIETGAIAVANDVVIDLNGYTLTRIAYHTGSDESNARHFVTMAVPASCTITSSDGRGALYCVAAYRPASGEITYTKSALVHMTKDATAVNIKFELSNIDIYSHALVHQRYYATKTETKTLCDITIDNIRHYSMRNENTTNSSIGNINDRTSEHIFTFLGRTDFTLNVTNSLFYSPDASTRFILLTDADANDSVGGKAGEDAVINFTNCDIIKDSTDGEIMFYTKRPNNTTMIFENCRVYDMNISEEGPKYVDCQGAVQPYHPENVAFAAKGTYLTDDGKTGVAAVLGSDLDAGFAKKNVYKTFTYTVPTNRTFLTKTEGNVEVPDLNFETKVIELAFNYVVTKPVDVSFTHNGETTVVPVYPGANSPVPQISVNSADPYASVVYTWVNGEGKEFSDKDITWDGAEYSYTSSQNTKLIGAIKGAMFNMTFVTGFQYNLYLPVDSNVVFNSVGAFNRAEGTVYINGGEYYVFTYAPSTSGASEDLQTKVSFTYNNGTYGGDYECYFTLSALVYADLMLADASLDEAEVLAVRNMVRYIKEARAYTGADVSDERFTALTEGLEDYGEYEEGTGTLEDLVDYISEATFVIYKGSAFYRFNLQSEEYFEALTFTLTVGDEEVPLSIIDSGVVDGVAYVTLEGARVYDIIGELTITNEAAGVSATYSLLDYIQSEDNPLAKALYEFGVAAKNYREYLEGENS